MYSNSIKYHIQFQYNCTTPPPPQMSSDWPCIQYASCLAKVWPNYVIFPILFQVWSKILSPISNQVLHSTFKTWREQLPKKMLLGCLILKLYFLRGSSKAYSLYKVCITLHFTVPDKKVNKKTRNNGPPGYKPSPKLCSWFSQLDSKIIKNSLIEVLMNDGI